MSSLKRTASLAFLNDDQPATSCTSSTSNASQPTAVNRKKMLGHSKSAVFPQRSPTIKSYLPIRRGSTFGSIERARSASDPSSSRFIKRQKIDLTDDTISRDWQFIVGSPTMSVGPHPTAIQPGSGPTNIPSQLSSTLLGLVSPIGFGFSSQPARSCSGLPHLADDQSSSKANKLGMQIREMYEEDQMSMQIDFPAQAVHSSLPPSPIPTYTPLQWALLSRHPHLVDKALSAQSQSIRLKHNQFVQSNYVKDANPRFHPAKVRQSSPLASGTTVVRTPYAATKVPPAMTTDRSVRRMLGQPESAKRTRWANYPTCSEKFPGPDKPGSIFRNTLLLNFGEWLKKTNMWISVQITGIRMVMSWYENRDDNDEGSITPEVDHEMLGSITDITEAHFTR
ncbi:hypothetical protein FRC17_005396 [Serendipita sp. 399]|nr:hypothetical protein FRC17_005396 [Serendipita sp. 399]